MQNCNFIKAGQPQRPFCQASEGRVARARFRNVGAGSWPVASRNNFPGDGRSFRDSHGKPAPSLARAPLFCSLPSFWRWGVAGRASRNERDLGRPVAAMAVLSTRSGQVARSLNSGRDRFHTVPYKEVISGQAEPFLSRACRMATLSGPASRSGRLSKPMAVVSRPASLWPFYQEWPLCQD